MFYICRNGIKYKDINRNRLVYVFDTDNNTCELVKENMYRRISKHLKCNQPENGKVYGFSMMLKYKTLYGRRKYPLIGWTMSTDKLEMTLEAGVVFDFDCNEYPILYVSIYNIDLKNNCIIREFNMHDEKNNLSWSYINMQSMLLTVIPFEFMASFIKNPKLIENVLCDMFANIVFLDKESNKLMVTKIKLVESGVTYVL